MMELQRKGTTKSFDMSFIDWILFYSFSVVFYPILLILICSHANANVNANITFQLGLDWIKMAWNEMFKESKNKIELNSIWNGIELQLNWHCIALSCKLHKTKTSRGEREGFWTRNELSLHEVLLHSIVLWAYSLWILLHTVLMHTIFAACFF